MIMSTGLFSVLAHQRTFSITSFCVAVMLPFGTATLSALPFTSEKFNYVVSQAIANKL
jgi:hypothetical protein